MSSIMHTIFFSLSHKNCGCYGIGNSQNVSPVGRGLMCCGQHLCLFSASFKFSKVQDFETVLIQIRPRIFSLTWVQIVCKGYQQRSLSLLQVKVPWL